MFLINSTRLSQTSAERKKTSLAFVFKVQENRVLWKSVLSGLWWLALIHLLPLNHTLASLTLFLFIVCSFFSSPFVTSSKCEITLPSPSFLQKLFSKNPRTVMLFSTSLAARNTCFLLCLHRVWWNIKLGNRTLLVYCVAYCLVCILIESKKRRIREENK